MFKKQKRAGCGSDQKATPDMEYLVSTAGAKGRTASPMKRLTEEFHMVSLFVILAIILPA